MYFLEVFILIFTIPNLRIDIYAATSSQNKIKNLHFYFCFIRILGV
jgi:hypothetical protein